MAITYYAGDRLVGLSTDIKPLDIADGATFAETDTLATYIKIDGVWTLYVGQNPNGGIISMATVNYLATLVGQFINLTIGATSAALMNLPLSILEPMNLYAKTFLFDKFANGLAAYDRDCSNISGTGLPALINPAHLQMQGKFNATGVRIITTGANDLITPLYKSGASTSPILLSDYSNAGGVTPLPVQLVGGVATASAEVGSNTADKAFDGDVGTYWECNTGMPAWLMYDFAGETKKLVTSYTITFSTYYATAFTFEGSDNGIDWTVIDTVTGNGSLTVSKSLNATSFTTKYKMYRLNITAASGTGTTVRVTSFTGSVTPVSPYTDISVKKFGTSSAKFLSHGIAYKHGVNLVALRLNYIDWRVSGFYMFNDLGNGLDEIQGLFNIGAAGSSRVLDITKIASGLRVSYSSDGSNWVNNDSDAVAWEADTWYWICVGRTGNTITVTVNDTIVDTIDVTGVALANPNASDPTGYIGLNYAKNTFRGWIDEFEFFINENPTHTMPVATRDIPYIKSVSWQSSPTYVATIVDNIYCAVMLDNESFASFGVNEVNVDTIFSISLDNGATWDVINLVRSTDVSTTSIMYEGSTDATLLNNTNQLVYKITSPDNKVLKLDGVILYWI